MIITIEKVYEQQLEMYENKTNTVENRIVSVTQPHIRPGRVLNLWKRVIINKCKS